MHILYGLFIEHSKRYLNKKSSYRRTIYTYEDFCFNNVAFLRYPIYLLSRR